MKDINLIRIFYMVCQSVLMYYLCVHFHVYYCTSNSSILTHIFIYFFKFSENVTLASLSVTQRLLALRLTSRQPCPSPIYFSPWQEPCWPPWLSPSNCWPHLLKSPEPRPLPVTVHLSPWLAPCWPPCLSPSNRWPHPWRHRSAHPASSLLECYHFLSSIFWMKVGWEFKCARWSEVWQRREGGDCWASRALSSRA